MSEVSSTSGPAPTLCPRHPDKLAAFVCERCRRAFCIHCCHTMPDGTISCLECLNTPATVELKPVLRMADPPPLPQEEPVAVSLPRGAGCIQHPNTAPVATCQLCGAGSCATCDFSFPDNLHLCPVCAPTAHARTTPKRRKFLVASYVLAAWSTLWAVLVFNGALAGLVNAADKSAEFVLGIIIIAVVFIPSSVGTGLGFSAMARHAPNPISVWIAAIWNALILGAMML